MAKAAPSGSVILLNGTSSSGKTTLAQALQRQLAPPHFHLNMDLFQQCWPPGFLVYGDGVDPPSAEGFLAVFRDDALSEVRIGPAGFRHLTGVYRAIAGWASAGNHIIVDDVIYHRRVLRAAVAALHTLPLLFVGVRCPLAVAEQRERDRSDRAPGGARTFFTAAHAHDVYDLEVDTATYTPEEAATLITTAVARNHSRTAFRQLARTLGIVDDTSAIPR